MPEQQWAVIITSVPPAGGFLSKLFGGGPQAPVLAAIESVTALPLKQARALLSRTPVQLARFATQQEAKVAAQTLEDAGATCEVRAL
ncbi:ribosomal protein L7/L12 [bacterium]|nr:ribosomal protein L7/L12 [bacterium]